MIEVGLVELCRWDRNIVSAFLKRKGCRVVVRGGWKREGCSEVGGTMRVECERDAMFVAVERRETV